MVTGAQIVAVAREYIGTPWHHAGRLKGVGVDCVGLLACVLKDLGEPVEDELSYTRQDEFTRMMAALNRHGRKLRKRERHVAGDVLVFRNAPLSAAIPMYNHCGIYTGPEDDTVIHAWSTPSVGKVVETPMDAHWWRWKVAAFRYRPSA